MKHHKNIRRIAVDIALGKRTIDVRLAKRLYQWARACRFGRNWIVEEEQPFHEWLRQARELDAVK